MKLWPKFAVALFVATLLYGGQLRMWTNHRNRFLEHWQASDGLSLVLGLAGVAAALLLAREALARWSFSRKIANHLFILVLGGALISTFLSYPDYKSELLYLALVALVTWSWCRPERRVPQRLARAALLFSPLAAIASFQALRYPQWHSASEPPPTSVTARPGAHPIFIFIFDEWSYARSTENGEFLPLFKNLRQLGQNAYVFQSAQSAGPRTDVSIPRFLFQTNDKLVIGSTSTYWERDQKLTPTVDTPSLFSLARERGYASTLRGFYLPYRRMLGTVGDSVSSELEHPKADDFAGQWRNNLVRNVGFWHDPLSRRVSKAFEQSVSPQSREAFSQHWEKINRRLRQATLSLIAQSPPNSFTVVHFPLPHCPWIFNPDGTYAGPYRGERMSHDPAAYRNHLAYLDVVIGQFLAALRESGKYDDALIVMTSDHSWRLDYTVNGKLTDSAEVRHVPLFIKLPGQHENRPVDATFHLTDLRPLLDAVMQGQLDAARAALPANR